MAKKRGFTHESTHNESQEWYTPPSVFEALKGLRFDLDPASPGADVVPWIPADQHFTIADNGLLKKWDGKVWLNPPYGTDTPTWVRRFINHRCGIMLVFARTDTDWFHENAIFADGLCFVRKRIKFVRGDGYVGQGSGAASLMLSCGFTCTSALEKSGLGFFVRGKGTRPDERGKLFYDN